MRIENHITAISLKDRILASSRHILALEGYNGLSMRKIAKAVDCKAASIYHHFENKDKIVHTLIDEGYQLQLQAMNNAIADLENPIARLEARTRAYIDFGINHPELYHIMYILITKDMERYPKENYRRNSHNVIRTIEDLNIADTEDLITLQADPVIIASTGAAMLHGLVSLLISNRLHVKLDTDQFKEMLVQQVLALYAPKRG